MRRKNSVVIAVLMSGLAAFGFEDYEYAAAVKADLANEIRPGGVNGQPFWNEHANMFMYPPRFDFPEAKGAKKYRFEIICSDGSYIYHQVSSPKESLKAVWPKIPTGWTTVVCRPDDSGNGWYWPGAKPLGTRLFWKSAPFTCNYPIPKRSFDDSALLAFKWTLHHWTAKSLLEKGEIDDNFSHNAYPTKMLASKVRAMVAYSKLTKDDAERELAMKYARACADWLIKNSDPKDAPLAYFPPTYRGKNFSSAEYGGQCMLIYPADAAEAYIALYNATKDAKYLAAAENVAGTYLKLQGEDGVWPLKLAHKDGMVICPNRLVPINHVIPMLEDLYELTKKSAYRDAAAKAFANLKKTRIDTWNWEGQFEDVRPNSGYVDLTKHDACATAIYVLRRYPGDKEMLALARDLLRFAEDQFVCWEPAMTGRGRPTIYGSMGDVNGWPTPCALEQYQWYVPIDASAAKMLRTYLALYKAEGKPIDLAKARAMAGAITRNQDDAGWFHTHWQWGGDGDSIWMNCHLATGLALQELVEYEAAENETAKWQAAIDEAAKKGGRVVIPAGRHVLSSFHLRSNVELHLEKGAVLWQSGNRKGTLEGFINICNAENVSITGEGMIFGNAWELNRLAGSFAIRVDKSKNVKIENIYIRDSASWTMWVNDSEYVTIRRVKVDSEAGECTDGIDVNGSHILVEDCEVEAADDAFCVKSHSSKFVHEDIVFRNCIARSHCNAFKIGTATKGTLRHLRFEHCKAELCRRVYRDLGPMPENVLEWKPLPGAPWYLHGAGFGAINIECVDGGAVEDVVCDDIEIAGFQCPIFVRGGERYDFKEGGDMSCLKAFSLKDIVLKNIRGRADGYYTSTITGTDKCRVKNVTLENIAIECVGEGKAKNRQVTFYPGEELASTYPQPNMFDHYHLPAWGLFIDKVDNLKMNNVKFTLREGTVDNRREIFNTER